MSVPITSLKPVDASRYPAIKAAIKSQAAKDTQDVRDEQKAVRKTGGAGGRRIVETYNNGTQKVVFKTYAQITQMKRDGKLFKYVN